MSKDLLGRAGDIGLSEIDDLKIFPGNTIAELTAVIVQRSPGKFEVTKGRIPTREMFHLATKDKKGEIATLGYMLRTFKDDKWTEGSSAVCSMHEIWLVKKKIIFEVRRAFIESESGRVLLLPAFKTEPANRTIGEKTFGVYYKLPGTAIEEAAQQMLDYTLTPEILVDQTLGETISGLGIWASTPTDFKFYLAVNHYPDKITERWVIMIPVPSSCWEQSVNSKLEIKYLSSDELVVFRDQNLIDEKTFELALVGLSLESPNKAIADAATQLLKERKFGYERNIFLKGEEDILELRNNIEVQ